MELMIKPQKDNERSFKLENYEDAENFIDLNYNENELLTIEKHHYKNLINFQTISNNQPSAQNQDINSLLSENIDRESVIDKAIQDIYEY